MPLAVYEHDNDYEKASETFICAAWKPTMTLWYMEGHSQFPWVLINVSFTERFICSKLYPGPPELSATM